MTNKNVPIGQQADSGSNQGLSFTGDDQTQSTRPNLTGSTEHSVIIDVQDAATKEGSENNPILLDSTPEEPSPVEHQPRQFRQSRNPKFFGDRRYIDIVLEEDDQTTQVSTVQEDTFNYPRATFTITSPSHLLTPIAEAPPQTTLVAETILTLSSQKSTRRDEQDTPQFNQS